MLDQKLLRENPEYLREACRLKRAAADVDRAVAADARRRAIQSEEESLQAERNAAAKDIAARKRAGEDTTALQVRMKAVGERIAVLADERRQMEDIVRQTMLIIPNHPAADVPEGDDGDGNVEVARHGGPMDFDFAPRPHWELGEALGLFDLKRGAKIAGSGFVPYTGAGARLERAMISFFLDLHTRKHGYREVFPPSLVNAASMTGTGNLPKFAEDAYTCDKGDDLYLIPTAEVPVTNLHRDEIFEPGTPLPRYAAFSSCFRREAGSAGKDTRGLLRVHEFHKVELVRFATAEEGEAQLEELRRDVGAVFEALGLHYRVMKLCSGDLGFSAAKCYDFEVWAPGVGKYLECSSCSHFGDYQARRMNIRHRDAERKTRFAHTLNASGAACPRTMVALLETHQNPDGTVTIPEALRPYMHGEEILR